MQDTMIQNATVTVRLQRDLNSLKENVEMSQTQLMKVNENIQTIQDSLTWRTYKFIYQSLFQDETFYSGHYLYIKCIVDLSRLVTM